MLPQLIDDMLDFTASAAELGKPGGGADLKLGLATAPALYAWDEFPELGELIERKFDREGDVERVSRVLVHMCAVEDFDLGSIVLTEHLHPRS